MFFCKLRSTQAKRFFRALKNIGNKSEVAFPSELLPMFIKSALRAPLTQQAFQLMLSSSVLPFWAERQYRPASNGFIPRMSWLSFNLTYRCWTALGYSGHPDEAVVDPAGLLSPLRDYWSVDAWLEINGELVIPSKRDDFKQTYVAPNALVTTVKTSDWTFELEHFCDSAFVPSVFGRATIKNLSAKNLKGRLIASIRPYNMEGIAPLFKLEFDKNSNVFIADNTPICALLFKPDKVVLSTLKDGDVINRLDVDTPYIVESNDGLCFGCAQKSFELKPGDSACIDFVAPMDMSILEDKKKKEIFIKKAPRLDFSEHKSASKMRVKEALNVGAKFTFPDQKFQESFEAARWHLFCVDDGDTITPGPLTYHQQWFRDAAYIVSALDVLGWHDKSAQKIKRFPKLQKRSGFFCSQNGEWDANGQAIWTIAKHYKFTRNEKLIKKLWRSVWKGALWIDNKRLKEAQGLHKGLLPSGFSAEHFGPSDFYYWDDFWCAAGLREASYLAKRLGREDEANRLQELFNNFWRDIENSINRVSEKLGRAVIPTGPYRDFDAAAIGSVCALYPLRLLKPFDDRLANTLGEIESKYFFNSLFFQDFVHSGMNIYLSAQVAQCRLFRREKRAFEIMQKILDVASPTYTWPEAIHPKTGYGCMGDGHHIWATADWVHLLRNMLFFEEGDNIIITAVVPQSWYEAGKKFGIENAPSEFGQVSFTIECTSNAVSLKISGNYFDKPNKIVWHLPFIFKSATVGEKVVAEKDNKIVFEPSVSKVVVTR